MPVEQQLHSVPFAQSVAAHPNHPIVFLVGNEVHMSITAWTDFCAASVPPATFDSFDHFTLLFLFVIFAYSSNEA